MDLYKFLSLHIFSYTHNSPCNIFFFTYITVILRLPYIFFQPFADTFVPVLWQVPVDIISTFTGSFRPIITNFCKDTTDSSPNYTCRKFVINGYWKRSYWKCGINSFHIWLWIRIYNQKFAMFVAYGKGTEISWSSSISFCWIIKNVYGLELPW